MLSGEYIKFQYYDEILSLKSDVRQMLGEKLNPSSSNNETSHVAAAVEEVVITREQKTCSY